MRAEKRRPGGVPHRPGESRNHQLVRLLRVMRDLDVLGGVDLYELAERHGTTDRTIRRDLEALEEAGIPLVEERAGKRKRWSVAYRDRVASGLSQVVDASHFLALRMAMGEGRASRGATGIHATLEDLAGKIEQALGPTARERLKDIDGCFLSDERFAYRRAPAEVFWPLVDAITGRRLCRVTYRAARPGAKDSVLAVLPLKLLAHEGATYVLCHLLKRRSVGPLNLQRLKKLVVMKERGTPPADFDAARWERSSFGIFAGGRPTRYRFRFDPVVAPYIRERTWHPTQRLKELADGGVELDFHCGASVEVTAWAASWRDHVEALAPAALRRELRGLGRWMDARYAPRSKPRR